MYRMSDRYNLWIGVSMSQTFKVTNSLEESVRNYKRIEEEVAPIKQVSTGLLGSYNHDCRELLMDSISRIRQSYSAYANVVFIRFASTTAGSIFNESMQKKLKQFSEICMGETNPQVFNLAVEEGYGVLSYNTHMRSSYHHRDAATASLLLYIFRNVHIIDWCLETARENSNGTISLKRLLRKLSGKFLGEFEWGDESNENIPLAAFCYFLAIGDTAIYDYDSDGPKEYAEKNLQPITIYRFTKEIVLPFLETRKRKLHPDAELSSVLPVHSSINHNLTAMLRAFILSECK